MTAGWKDSARRILPLAWPVFIGQLAVLGFSTVDTLLLARHDALDLAALAVGAPAYITVFVGLMGVLLAVSPVVGRLYGAGHVEEAGAQLPQAAWLALGMALIGSSLLAFPQPFLSLSHASPEVAVKVRAYMRALAVALPASLLFMSFRSFNVAVSRPKAIMAMQLASFALKVPLSALLIGGADWQGLHVPALGVAGCGIATAVVNWCQALSAIALLRLDPFYRRFAIWGRGFVRPRREPIVALLRLGVPMGISILIEVSGFTFMAFFISRLDPKSLPGHQIAANLVALLYMVPLGLANGTSTLVAQRIGARDLPDARRLGWHGLWIAAATALVLSCTVLALRGPLLRLYTHDTIIIAAAMPLLAWVALFHVGDATQTIAVYVLRAWEITAVPVAIYALALWGIGLGGGYWLADGHSMLHGARGLWAASAASLAIAAMALIGLLSFAARQRAGGPTT